VIPIQTCAVAIQANVITVVISSLVITVIANVLNIVMGVTEEQDHVSSVKGVCMDIHVQQCATMTVSNSTVIN
jgi:hypothetical protein